MRIQSELWLFWFLLIVYRTGEVQANSNNSTSNITATTNMNTTEKPVTITAVEKPLQVNDSKVGAASSDSHQIAQGLGSYSKFSTEGGFQPSPFLGLVPPVQGRPREVFGFGEAFPVPLHESRPGGYVRNRLYPQRGYAAKPNLNLSPLDQDNHLHEDTRYQYEPPEYHHTIQEQHHEIPGHVPEPPIQGDISVQPDVPIHPVPSHGPESSGRHPALPGQPLKIPGYHKPEHFPYNIHETVSSGADFPPTQFSQSPEVIFPGEENGGIKFIKDPFPGQLTYPLPHDVKPVEEEQHDDTFPGHVDAQSHGPAHKTHIPTQHSILHKLSPWKGVLKFLATLVPLGLLVAALQPSVLLVNATEPPIRPIPGVTIPGVGPPIGVPPGVLTKYRAGSETDTLIAAGAGESCDKRQLCDALVASASNPINLQLAYVAMATRLKGEQKKTLDEVMEKVANRKCREYSCPSLLAPPPTRPASG